jgi:hypothetical protein
MQPENSQNTFLGAEQQPIQPVVGAEGVPTIPPLDAVFERGQERKEQAAEAGAMASNMAVSGAPVAPVQPVIPVASVTDPAVSTVISPLVAADEDLIEKEWVDKAKEIIEQTKDDPYTRTAKVNELQRDYLQKRYGKVVGAGE